MAAATEAASHGLLRTISDPLVSQQDATKSSTGLPSIWEDGANDQQNQPQQPKKALRERIADLRRRSWDESDLYVKHSLRTWLKDEREQMRPATLAASRRLGPWRTKLVRLPALPPREDSQPKTEPLHPQGWKPPLKVVGEVILESFGT